MYWHQAKHLKTSIIKSTEDGEEDGTNAVEQFAALIQFLNVERCRASERTWWSEACPDA